MTRPLRLFALLVGLLAGNPCLAAHLPIATLTDADGVALSLATPARRIVTLAPHLTEMLLTLGARAQIVAVSDDHETRGAHATSRSGFPVISDAVVINHERLQAARPDLVLAWAEGTPRAWIAQLRRQGQPVFVVGAAKLDDLARQIETLGTLTGHERAAAREAAAVRQTLANIAAEDRGGPRLRYFLQVWRQPLYSLHAGHLLSQALARCGADNIVPAGRVAAPLINPEFVLQQNPDVIVLPGEDVSGSRAYWQRFSRLPAVRRQQWLVMTDDRLTRPGPGMLSAVLPICAQLQEWRRPAGVKAR